MGKRGPDFSGSRFFLETIRTLKPELEFRGRTRQDWQAWRERFRSKLIQLIGEYPPEVPLAPKILKKIDCGDHIREMVVLSTTRSTLVPAWVLIPKGARQRRRKGERLPALLCLHGHGPGMDPVAGVDDGDAAKQQEIRRLNYDYGLQFVRRGYITMTPEFRSFGRRGDREASLKTFRDLCNLNHIKASLLGYNLIALELWDLKRSLDYLESRPEVDASRIGCVGLSYGGTMTMYLSALDERIRAAVISCYATTFRYYAIEIDNFCGSQYVPGIARYGDIAEIIGLIAPRPVCLENGLRDDGFPVEEARIAHERVRRIYRAAGVPRRLVVDIFDGFHQFSGRKAFSFIKRYL